MHPRMIEMYADTPFLSILTGVMSAYVSSLESSTFICGESGVTAAIMSGRDLYESGPATRSTIWLSSSLSFSLSAMHPTIPMMTSFLRSFCRRNWSIRPHILCSALSLMEQVLASMTSAREMSSVRAYPWSWSMDRMTSLSFTFIWQPYVSM